MNKEIDIHDCLPSYKEMDESYEKDTKGSEWYCYYLEHGYFKEEKTRLTIKQLFFKLKSFVNKILHMVQK
jgi:hypothetical protein